MAQRLWSAAEVAKAGGGGVLPEAAACGDLSGVIGDACGEGVGEGDGDGGLAEVE